MKRILLALFTVIIAAGYTMAQEMTFVTQKGPGERIQLTVKSDGGFTIEGVEEAAVEGFSGYTLKSPVVKLIGKVVEFSSPYSSINEIDVTNMPGIETLDVFGNPIQKIDLSKNEGLLQLLAGGTNLTSLDISSCPNLTTLNINSCKIPEIDFSNNSELAVVLAKSSGLKNLKLKGANSLDVLDCSYNDLGSIDLSDVPTLTQLSCAGNNLDALDISSVKLIVLNCNANNLSSLDLKGQTALEEIGCVKNKIEALDFTDCSNLFGIMMYGNRVFDKQMTALVNSLHTVLGTTGYFTVVDQQDAEERNECSIQNVNAAVEKNWDVFDFAGGMSGFEFGESYEGMADELLFVDDIAASDFNVYFSAAEKNIFVAGVAAGEKISLVDMSGAEVMNVVSDGSVTVIPTASLHKGVYVVSCAAGSVKTIVK